MTAGSCTLQYSTLGNTIIAIRGQYDCLTCVGDLFNGVYSCTVIKSIWILQHKPSSSSVFLWHLTSLTSHCTWSHCLYYYFPLCGGEYSSTGWCHKKVRMAFSYHVTKMKWYVTLCFNEILVLISCKLLPTVTVWYVVVGLYLNYIYHITR